MKTLITALALLIAVLAAPFSASAQTAITRTTLSAAVTVASPQSLNITVASATGIAVNGILFVDGSVYRVLAVSGTTITVINQYRPATHLNAAGVYLVPSAAQIGLNPVGSCLRSTAGVPPAYSPYTILFNLSTGDMATCRGATGSLTWYITNPYGYSPSGQPPVTQ